MSVEDAKRAVDIGCTGIMVSNHGGRQLDGSRAPLISLQKLLMLLEINLMLFVKVEFREELICLKLYH